MVTTTQDNIDVTIVYNYLIIRVIEQHRSNNYITYSQQQSHKLSHLGNFIQQQHIDKSQSQWTYLPHDFNPYTAFTRHLHSLTVPEFN